MKRPKYAKTLMDNLRKRGIRYPTITDHWNYDRSEGLTFQPYQVEGEHLRILIEEAEKIGCKIRLSGQGSHDPDCIKIYVYKK